MMNTPVFSKFATYYHTVKYLKWIQLYGQLRFRFSKPSINLSPPPPRRHMLLPLIKTIAKTVHMPARDKIVFLNQEREIASPAIWSQPEIDKLWLYHLHYFDVLNAPQGVIAWQQALIERWIQENPPAQGNGWESYTLSLRSVNWMKWLMAGNEPVPGMLHSLAIQIRYLYKRLEVHLLGNHLLANAKALVFAGLFFEGKEAKRWLRKGLTCMHRELKEQVLADGGHFELSPMYQGIILEDVLDLVNVFNAYGERAPTQWRDLSDAMSRWLNVMCHPDEDIAFFNDAALGMAPTVRELNAYRQRLQHEIETSISSPFTYLADSGYCRMQSGPAVLIADIAEVGASYQPGHAHADTLSFELSLGRQRVMVNSGTSLYAEGKERCRQRSSKAHNTLVINDQDSSQVWKSFRVAKRARVQNIDMQPTQQERMLTASHDGYYKTHKVLHTRTWRMRENELIIQDYVSGTGEHKIELFFHLHPDIQAVQQDAQTILLQNKAKHALATVQTSHPVMIAESSYHPAFNQSLVSQKLMIETRQSLPTSFTTTIKWKL